MSLPEINILPVHEIELKVCDRTIKFVPFTVEQERNILMALESNEINDLLNNYIQILKSCIQDEIDWDNLSTVDFINLIVAIRSKSKGELLELKNPKCSNCEKTYDQSFLIEDSIRYKNEKHKKDVIKISDDLTLELKPLDYKFLYNLDKMKNEIDLYIHSASYSISKIIYKEKIFKITDINELKEKIVSKLTLGNLTEIFKKCKDFITIHLVIDFKCPHCNHQETVDMDNFLKLLK